eukprot:TRINITY_DN42957_c0_g1_i1.p1 TRINITY_DN42957_c0_g1~~TRINITY_DN42957_c0_g1_i1.p1  ORF type:complete len:303 (-),score=43.84 TRINITY_DN42957_c0_g1_i1:38-946(-)
MLRIPWPLWPQCRKASAFRTAIGTAAVLATVSGDMLRCSHDISVHQLAFGPMENFQYLITSRGTALLVDAAWDPPGILARVEEMGLKLAGLAYTHAHADHVGGFMGQNKILGAAEFRAGDLADSSVDSLPLQPLWIGEGDLKDAVRQSGIERSGWKALADGDRLEVFDEDVVSVTAVDTPGHSRGGVSFFVGGRGIDPAGPCSGGVLLTGDTLFVGNVGRTDLPGSSAPKLFRSLSRLSRFSDETVVLPGHNYGSRPRSTIGDERRENSAMRRGIKDYPPEKMTAPLPERATVAPQQLRSEL